MRSIDYSTQYNIDNDEKLIDWRMQVEGTILIMRKTYSYGIMMSAFSSFALSKDKHSLCDDIVKVLKMIREEFKIPDTAILQCVRDSCASALKLKYV